MDKVLVGLGLILLSVTLVVAAVIGLTAKDFAADPELALDPKRVQHEGENDVVVTLGAGRQVEVPSDKRPETMEDIVERIKADVMTPEEISNYDGRYLSYTIKKGETLGKIAERYLGKSSMFPLIVDHNRELRNPNAIAEGTVIRIPMYLKQPR